MDPTHPDTEKAGLLCQIVSPIGMLGYGFDVNDLEHGLEITLSTNAPTAIIIDSGSTDGGPNKLALGGTTTPRSSYERDLRKLIRAVKIYRVPLLISSAGGDGSDAHVKEFLDIIDEIQQSDDQGDSVKLKVLAIYSQASPDLLLQKLANNKISGCGPCVPFLTEVDILASPTIVGQIGPEPFVQAMATHPDFDILISGRAYDPSLYVAFCAFHAFNKTDRPFKELGADVLGGFTHMGKIMECGGVCATPKSSAAMAKVYADGTFDIRPLAEGSRCTTQSVAAHSLYEKSRPDILPGPGGNLDLNTATYQALGDGITVRAKGAIFRLSRDNDGVAYTIKFEGAKVVGHRSIFIGSFCDPILIAQLPSFLRRVKEYVVQQHVHVDKECKWELEFHVYGQNPCASSTTQQGEVFMVGEALADTQSLAASVSSCARIACVHGSYEGQKATSGNLGMGIGGQMNIEMGPCAQFSIYHLLEMKEGEEEAVEISPDGEDQSIPIHRFIRWEMRWIGDGPSLDHNKPRVLKSSKNDFTENNQVQTTPEETLRSGPLTGTHLLGTLAQIIRSKNSGPYEITLDVMFSDPTIYNQIKASNILTADNIASLYDMSVEDIVWCGFFDPALAFKATIPRRARFSDNAGKDSTNIVVSSGGPWESDVHGSQKYLPLMKLEVDLDILTI
ncbi:Protein of unknown function DUF1446 [Penicillium occitanis (nom. inval.)]|nr:Protein of unknown function DUF1446 [Penicillium occitanis (nom. inval.)]PCG89344.1 hypothetical protein PENOC_106900 [Penicillium occitanis (nom. inval.)]